MIPAISAMVCGILAIGCGGNSGTGNQPPPNPVAVISSIAPGVLAAGAPDTTLTVTGTNFLSSSTVDFNGTALATTFLSSTQLSAVVPASDLGQAGADHITVSTPPPGGGTSGAQPLTVTAISSFVLMATPAQSGQGNGAWLVTAAAVDSTGTAVAGLPVSLNAGTAMASQTQGLTDSNGTFQASVSPPAAYSGEPIAVSAMTGAQTAAVDIAFVSSVFNPANRISVGAARRPEDSVSPGSAVSSPFITGVAGPPGSSNPFALNPSLCYTNIDLETTVPAACQSTYSNQSLTQGLLNFVDTACNVGEVLVGGGACLGLVATPVACLLSETGVGAAICVGGLANSDLLTGLCAGFITHEMAKAVFSNKTDQAAVEVIGIQPGAPNPADAFGLICDAIDQAAIGIGNGTSGTQVTISPKQPIAIVSGTIDFTATVTGNGNTAVTWSVNGVTGGSPAFGTVNASGVYTAPSSVPPFPWVTVRATSAADSTASAPAVTQVVANAPGTILTVAGNGTAGYSGDGGPATSAQLLVPSGVAFDGGGNMFIADSSNNVVRRVDATTGDITTIAGTGAAGYSGDGGPGTAAQLNRPTHVVFDRTVNLYITDAGNARIRQVNAVTGEITTVAGNGTSGYSGDGGPATSAELNFPDGVALDNDGNLYIGDAQNNRIRKVTIATGIITTVAGNGVAGFAGDGQLATNAELDFPSRPALDAAGNLYIADFQNNRVRRVDAVTNVITTIAGTGTAGYGGDGSAAAAAELNGPLSVTVDANGNVYIADTNNQRIRVVNTNAAQISVLGTTLQPGNIGTVAGNGVLGYSGDGGPAVNARIDFPTGLLVDSQGNLYFADAQNNVVRRVTGN